MVEAVVSFAIERLHDLLTEEASLSHGVSNKVKQLQNELKRMQCFLRDAEKRHDEDESTQNWISEIRRLAHDAEDAIEIYAIKVAYGRIVGTKSPLYRGIYLLKVGSDITPMNTRISDLTRSLQSYGLNATRDREESRFLIERQRQPRRSYSHIVEELVLVKQHLPRRFTVTMLLK